MKHTFTILGRLSGANDAISATNRHRYAGAQIKRSETKRCAMAAIAGGVPKIKTQVNIHFYWLEPNKRRDKDNIRYAAKYILDGLRECGALGNDGWAQILHMSDMWGVDKANPRIEIEIEELA